MILLRFFYSKHISPYNLVVYINQHLSLYKQLIAIESKITSMFAFSRPVT